MKGEEKWKYCISAASALIALNVFIGTAAMIFDEKDGDKFVAAAIQPNSLSGEKWNDDSLEIGEVFTLNGNTYCFITIGSVACLEGDVPIGTRIVYDNVVYEVI